MRTFKFIAFRLSQNGFKRNNFIVIANSFSHPFNLFFGVMIDIISQHHEYKYRLLMAQIE